ncbi:hypothetical protein HQ520_03505 [bacterium]|nr:hypothetical protein [bacterium]
MTQCPNVHQLEILDLAVDCIDRKGLAIYLRLRDLLRGKPDGYQGEFRPLFARYYGLNSAGLTEAFKDRYFKILFGLECDGSGDPYTDILQDLYQFPRRKGDHSLQCSFVSKLVAIHDENRPIFDRHVSDFFGLGPPSAGSPIFRIAGFISNLEAIRANYMAWGENEKIRGILGRLLRQCPELEDCAVPQLIDFLIWAAGNKRLGSRAQ